MEVQELKGAEDDWLISVQVDLKNQDNFKQLVCELGIKEYKEILRCEGRLLNSDLDSKARKPVILPRQRRFTRLVVEECHRRVHHSGIRSTFIS